MQPSSLVSLRPCRKYHGCWLRLPCIQKWNRSRKTFWSKQNWRSTAQKKPTKISQIKILLGIDSSEHCRVIGMDSTYRETYNTQEGKNDREKKDRAGTVIGQISTTPAQKRVRFKGSTLASIISQIFHISKSVKVKTNRFSQGTTWIIFTLALTAAPVILDKYLGERLSKE